MNTAEVAKELGVSRTRVIQLAEDRSDFPSPHAVTYMGDRELRLWLPDDVFQWNREADRSPGRRHRVMLDNGVL